MLYLCKLPFVSHENDAREEALSSLAEKFVGIGCDIRDERDQLYVIGNPFLSFKPLGRLSFLSTIDRIELSSSDNEIRMKIISYYRFALMIIVAMAIGFNIADRLYYDAATAMKIGLAGFIAVILTMAIFYINALRAKGFAQKALKSG